MSASELPNMIKIDRERRVRVSQLAVQMIVIVATCWAMMMIVLGDFAGGAIAGAAAAFACRGADASRLGGACGAQ